MCREVSGNPTDIFILYLQLYRHTFYLSDLSVGTHTHRERWKQIRRRKPFSEERMKRGQMPRNLVPSTAWDRPSPRDLIIGPIEHVLHLPV